MSGSSSGCCKSLTTKTEYDENKGHHRQGQLIALRTKLELQASVQTTLAHIVEIPAKSANSILQAVEAVIRFHNIINLQHLRRFVKPQHLPTRLVRPSSSSTVEISAKDASLCSAVSDDFMHRDVAGASLVAAHKPTLYFLICAASVLSYAAVLELLASLDLCNLRDTEPQIRTIPVPLLPPTSEEQAEHWSKEYWPTVYKKNNPYGPHPSIINRVEDEIRDSVGEFMDLAKLAGDETLSTFKGEPVGAVIVNRNAATGATPAVVAGDARWSHTDQQNRSGRGNIAAHAVMRAIGLVARKRRDLLGLEHSADGVRSSNGFVDHPLSGLEMDIYLKESLAPGGYLCLDLELYVTHEPCVMCSMAIIHSRFGKIVYGKRLPKTGGISADTNADVENDESGKLRSAYGLFWRPELNWKLLAWQWLDDASPPSDLSDLNTHA